MNDEVFLRNLVEFARALRYLGLRTSTTELLDAVRALDLAGLGDREVVKVVLKSTLIKSSDDAPLFDLAFDAFFVSPDIRRRQAALAGREKRLKEASRAACHEELRFLGKPLELEPGHQAAYLKMDPEERRRIVQFLEDVSKGLEGSERSEKFKPMVGRIVRGHIERWLNVNRRARGGPDSLTGDAMLSTVVAAGLSAGGMPVRASRPGLVERDLAEADDGDMPALEKATSRLARRLSSEVSRRMKAARKREVIDLRRTMRANIKYGGVLLDLRYRSRRVSKPCIWVVCDVSGSMTRYAAFVLKFVYALASVTKGIEAFAFSEDLEYITPWVKEWVGKSSVKSFLNEISLKSMQWGRGTDIGRSLAALLENHGHMITSKVTILVVSDAKTVAVDRATQSLAALSGRARAVIWLLTVPGEDLGRIPAVARFRPYCRLFQCCSLSQLEKIIRNELFG